MWQTLLAQATKNVLYHLVVKLDDFGAFLPTEKSLGSETLKSGEKEPHMQKREIVKQGLFGTCSSGVDEK